MPAYLRRILHPAARIVAGALLLVSVVVVDGRPVVFADSNIYFWMGQMQLRPVRYALSPWIGGPSRASEDPDAADEAPAEMQLRRTEMAARSPWFGTWLYVVAGWGNLWWLTLMQALAASFAIHALWRGLAPRSRMRDWLWLMAGLSVASTLPFFAGFAMPDVWAGLGVVSLAALMFVRDRTGPVSQGLLGSLVVACVAFHPTNGLVLLPSAILAGLIAVARLRRPAASLLPGLAWLLAAMVITSLMNTAYVGAIRAATGETLRSPPFLAARLLADGPGRRYLKAACAPDRTGSAPAPARGAPHWALCRFSHLPLTDSQDILWSGDPGKGVFGRASAAERIRIDQQQMDFALHVVASDPVGVLTAAAGNALQTLISVQLDDPLRDPHFYLTDPDWRDTFIADLVHSLGPCGPDELGCRPRFTQAQSALWHGGAFGLALVAVGWRTSGPAWRRGLQRGRRGVSETTAVLVLFAFVLILNAGLTGALSGPFARYQARLAWLAPLGALLVLSPQTLRRLRKSVGAKPSPD
jgi:flagellin-like protein